MSEDFSIGYLVGIARQDGCTIELVGDEIRITGPRYDLWREKLLPRKEELRRYLSDEPLDDAEIPPDPSAPLSATEMLDRLLDRLRRGEGDVLFSAGESFDGFEFGPGKITVIGAPPGAGKTALAMQLVIEAMQADPKLRVFNANAEMPFDVLLRRELPRRSGVPAKALRFADLRPHQLEAAEAVR